MVRGDPCHEHVVIQAARVRTAPSYELTAWGRAVMNPVLLAAALGRPRTETATEIDERRG